MDLVLKGFGFGLILALSFGPVFFSLIQTSIEKGFFAGFLMALGISICDTSFVVLSYLGFSSFIISKQYEYYIGWIGGIILIVLGIYSFFKRSRVKSPVKLIDRRGMLRVIIKGFIMNALSPFVLIFWVGAMGYATLDYGFEGQELKLFFGIVLITVLGSDILKAYLSDRMRRIIRPRIIRIMNIIVGIILIAFGVRIILFVM